MPECVCLCVMSVGEKIKMERKSGKNINSPEQRALNVCVCEKRKLNPNTNTIQIK